MNTLTKYIDDMNRWNAIFGISAVDMPLSQADAEALSNKLASELSPENLHCDGEISYSAAQKKYRYFNTVVKQLKTYCDKNGLTFKEPLY